MAFGRLERNRGPRPMSDINMTPLIDVMLVLLVIFMITAPLLTSRLRLDLPKADAGPPPADAQAFVTVAIDDAGRTFLDDVPLARDPLAERLAAAAQANPRLEVQLRADRRVPYGDVATLIALVQQAGLSRIGFVTEPGKP